QACNLGATPPTTDVVKGTTPGMGFTVRYITATPPLTPTPGGSDASVAVAAGGQSYTWALRAPGARKALAHGSGHASELRVPIPKHGLGLYALTVTAGPHQAVVPLV